MKEYLWLESSGPHCKTGDERFSPLTSIENPLCTLFHTHVFPPYGTWERFPRPPLYTWISGHTLTCACQWMSAIEWIRADDKACIMIILTLTIYPRQRPSLLASAKWHDFDFAIWRHDRVRYSLTLSFESDPWFRWIQVEKTRGWSRDSIEVPSIARKKTFNHLSRSLFFCNSPVMCSDLQGIEDETSVPSHGEYVGRAIASFTLFVCLLVFDRMRRGIATFAAFRVDICTEWVHLPKKKLDDPSTTACTSAMRSCRVYNLSQCLSFSFILRCCKKHKKIET